MSDIEARVKEVMVQTLDVRTETIDNGHSLVDNLGADSLDAVELIMALEDTFCIDIPELDARKLLTVQSIIDYVTAKVQQTADAEKSVA